jgi:hypothetical protein
LADNVTLDAGAGGDTIAADDVGGVKYQVIKLAVGADGAASLVADANPIPVSDAGGALTVDGTVAVTNAGLTELAAAINASSQMDVNIAASNATVTVANAGLTELAAAINGSSQVDVNIAAGGITGRAEDAAHSTGHEGVFVLAVRRDTAAVGSDTDGDYSSLNVDANGRLHVLPASHPVTNAGTFAVQVDGNALTALQLIDNASIADDAAFTPATTGVTMAGFFADETATDSVDEGDGGAARMTLDRKQIVTDYAHAAAGGTSSYSALSTAAVLTAEIKGSAGKVFSVQIFNINAAARYVRLYNQTGAPASTDAANIVWRGIIPGNTAGAGFVVQFPKGKQFATGIGIRASAAVADNDTTALAANELTSNVDYI